MYLIASLLFFLFFSRLARADLIDFTALISLEILHTYFIHAVHITKKSEDKIFY
jgi:hypothetical protein